MGLHFSLVGLGLLLTSIGLFAYVYSLNLYRIDWDWSLRISQPGKIYEFGIQSKLGLAVLAGLASLLFFQASLRIKRAHPRGLVAGRVGSFLLLASFPGAIFVRGLWLDIPGVPVSLVQFALDAAIILLFAQGALGLFYLIASLTPGIRQQLTADGAALNPAVRRVQLLAVVLWGAVVLGAGLVLAVATDWIEMSVSRPEPGDALYATTFDDYNDEWDQYEARDSATVVNLADAALDSAAGILASLDTHALVVTHGSPYAGEIIWSALDRTYNDIDLSVIGLPVTGAPEAVMYGVIFRYRDEENFYIFRVSGDGYYSLAKVEGGVEEKISDWGVSDLIRQGTAPNAVRVVAVQDAFRFYINGQPVPLCFRGDNLTSMWAGSECYTDELRYVYRDDSFRQGQIAMAVGTFDGSEVAVAFDDVLLVGPDHDLVLSDAG